MLPLQMSTFTRNKMGHPMRWAATVKYKLHEVEGDIDDIRNRMVHTNTQNVGERRKWIWEFIWALHGGEKLLVIIIYMKSNYMH